MSNKKVRLRLNTPNDIRKTLGKVTNMVANNEIDTKKANTIIYSCNCILNSIRLDDQEKRIIELEEIVNNDK